MNITTSEMSRIGANISIHKVLYDGKKDDASGITDIHTSSRHPHYTRTDGKTGYGRL